MNRQHWWAVLLFVGALAALSVGLADDLMRPSAKLRLVGLVLIGVLTWWGGHRIEEGCAGRPCVYFRLAVVTRYRPDRHRIDWPAAAL